MAGMARRGPRGAHSARHRAGRSQPDVANADAQVTDGSRPPDEFGQVVDGGPGPIGTTAFGTASVDRFGPMGGSEVGPDGAPYAASAPGQSASERAAQHGPANGLTGRSTPGRAGRAGRPRQTAPDPPGGLSPHPARPPPSPPPTPRAHTLR